MVSRKAQSKAGISEQRRGQQMGDERSQQSQSLEEKEDTPAMNGRRGAASKFYADASSQAVGSDGEAPSDVSPSTAAAIPTGQPQGQSGGEKVFKQRQAKTKQK
ncbi:MAG: hypothetical protein M3458_05670 [Acidobacteriota bacterium]|nr:hypothetical protein [Acidobacteriota bacterium]